MKAIIITPAAVDTTLGNRITADRWAGILRALGHDVLVLNEWSNEDCDFMVALHARRSHSIADRFRRTHPEHPLIVALAGTDLYNDLATSHEARLSLSMATRVVVLQEAALDELDHETRAKTNVIYQSAVRADRRQEPVEDCFEVCILSHLRDVKDPLRTAFAARLLPKESRIRIVHAGRALDARWAELAGQEQRENPRYRWIGEQSHEHARELMSRSRLLVLTSTMEGGANAIAEAVVCGVPVLCSDIPGNAGMLGRDYPGYFRVRDTQHLARMLHRTETDAAFLTELRMQIDRLQDRFAPERELECWHHLLQLLFQKPNPEAPDDVSTI